MFQSSVNFSPRCRKVGLAERLNVISSVSTTVAVSVTPGVGVSLGRGVSVASGVGLAVSVAVGSGGLVGSRVGGGGSVSFLRGNRKSREKSRLKNQRQSNQDGKDNV
jgi:hypothetical protein